MSRAPHAPSAASADDPSFEAAEMSSTHTGTPSWTESVPDAPPAPPGPAASGRDRDTARTPWNAARSPAPGLDPILDDGESAHGSQYQDAGSQPPSRTTSRVFPWRNSTERTRPPSHRELRAAPGPHRISPRPHDPYDPYDPYAHAPYDDDDAYDDGYAEYDDADQERGPQQHDGVGARTDTGTGTGTEPAPGPRSGAGVHFYDRPTPSGSGGAFGPRPDGRFHDQDRASAPTATATATGLLQQPRPALVHRTSSRNPDRGHPFAVERRATDADNVVGADLHKSDRLQPFFDPTWDDFMHEEPLEMPFFDHVVQRYGEFNTVDKIRLGVRQFLSFLITSVILSCVLVLSIANAMNPFAKRLPRSRADREYETRITGERGSARVQYYCEFWGYTCDEYEIVTEAGWILKAHRVSDPRRPGPPGHPVVCQHGILCNSSHFVMCEERSLAFWLVDQGYDVWLTNIRSNYGAGHTHYSRDDPRFWAFGLKELALDLVDVIEFICEATGFARVAYIGHSQGSGSMYAALSPGIAPELGSRLSVFIALGPSVYAGPVLRERFPFSLMRRFRSRQWWSLVFGVKTYIPAIGLFHQCMPTWLFGHIAAALFAFMFNFNLRLTPKRQLPKLFRSAAVSTSSELLYWYMAAWAHRGCIFDPRSEAPWFPPSFPPHSVFYGSVDMLVIGRPLADRLLEHERNVDVIHCVELDGYEHLDFLFAHDAWSVVYPGIRDSIEATIDEEDYPVSLDSQSDRDMPTDTDTELLDPAWDTASQPEASKMIEYPQGARAANTAGGTIKILPPDSKARYSTHDGPDYGSYDYGHDGEINPFSHPMPEPHSYVDRALDDGYQYRTDGPADYGDGPAAFGGAYYGQGDANDDHRYRRSLVPNDDGVHEYPYDYRY